MTGTNIYAPHNSFKHIVKQVFLNELAELYDKCELYSLKIIIGNANVHIHYQQAGTEA